MSYVRPNVWRLMIDRRKGIWEIRKEICVEFFIAQYTGAMKVWLETHNPRRFDSVEHKWVEEHTDVSDAVYVYGHTMINNKMSESPWVSLQMMEALGRGEVFGNSAYSFVNTCMYQFIIKGPADRSKYLRSGAPEWWELVQPKGEEK